MIRQFWVRHWFVLMLPVIFAAAWVAPAVAAKGGYLRPEVSTKAAVVAIFVLQGLVLPMAEVRAALTQTRLHLVVQGMTFIGLPLLGWSLSFVAAPLLTDELRLGILYLAVLPSTVSSAAVLTAAAGGNAAGAICNAVLSSLIGVVATPALVAWFFSGEGVVPTGGGGSFGAVVLELGKLILMPFLVGQLLRLRWGRWSAARKPRLATASSLCILFIVYAAFCEARSGEVWTGHGWRLPLGAGLAALGLFWTATWCTRRVIRLAGLNTADAIAAEFCAVQKTLASGVPLAGVIFGGDPRTGLILLPLLIYHPLQLTLHGARAARLARETRTPSNIAQ